MAKNDEAPKTAGIPPATGGALSVLQFTKPWADHDPAEDFDPEGRAAAVHAASVAINTYHKPAEAQVKRFEALREAIVNLSDEIVHNCPAGPYRSTALSRLAEVRMWANASIALEGV